MADAKGIYSIRENGAGRKRRADIQPGVQTRSLYVSSKLEHDEHHRHLDPDSRSNCLDTQAEESENPYKRKSRRKTREERYVPKGGVDDKRRSLSVEAPRKQKLFGVRNRNCRAGERFVAGNIKAGRLTLDYNEHLGIFKKGKTSMPVRSCNLPCLAFSEKEFLSKERQMKQNITDFMGLIQGQKSSAKDEAVALRSKDPVDRANEPKTATMSILDNFERTNTSHPRTGHGGSERGQSRAMADMVDIIEPQARSFETLHTKDKPSVSSNASPAPSSTRVSRIIDCPDALDYEKLCDSLRSCEQLKITYEEYTPKFSQEFTYTIEDLRCLLSARENAFLPGDFGDVGNATRDHIARRPIAEDFFGNNGFLQVVPASIKDAGGSPLGCCSNRHQRY